MPDASRCGSVEALRPNDEPNGRTGWSQERDGEPAPTVTHFDAPGLCRPIQTTQPKTSREIDDGSVLELDFQPGWTAPLSGSVVHGSFGSTSTVWAVAKRHREFFSFRYLTSPFNIMST